MAGCDTWFVEIDETWFQEKALGKYSSDKNWFSKYISKVQNIKNLNDKAYDSCVEEALNKNLTKAENTAACLGQETCYLTQVGYEKWEDHQKEVDYMDKEVELLWKEISAKAHVRNQIAARRNPFLSAAGPGRYWELRIWVKKIGAYYHASNMQVARIAVQEA